MIRRILTLYIASMGRGWMRNLRDLRGNTLKVYLYLLKTNKPVGVREVQRALGFSSPSLAYYHLEKLVSMGLVVKRYGDYIVKKDIDVDILRGFIRLGGLIIPRFILYAVLFTTILAYLILNPYPRDINWIYALVICVIASFIMLFEVYTHWRDIRYILE